MKTINGNDSVKFLMHQNAILGTILKVNQISMTINNGNDFFIQSLNEIASNTIIDSSFGLLFNKKNDYRLHYDTSKNNQDNSTIDDGQIFNCVENILQSDTGIIIDSQACINCIKQCNYADKFIYATKIGYLNEVYGVLVIFIKYEEHYDELLLDLLNDLGKNIGFQIYNITLRNEKERIQQELIVSKKNYYDTFERTPVGIFRTTIDGKPLKINFKMAEILGFDNSEKAINHYTDLGKQLYLYSEDRKKFISLLQKEGNVTNFQYQAYRFDGKIIWMTMNAVLNAEKGHIDGFTWDITKEKELELQIRKDEEYLRTTINSIGDGVIVTDLNGNITTINNIAQNITEYSLSEAKNKPLGKILNIINAKTRKNVPNPVTKVLESGKIVGLANGTILISKNGREYHIADSAAPIKNQNEDILGVVLVFRDITKKYKLQEELEINRQQLEFIIEGGNLGTYLWFIKSGSTIFNKRWMEMLGYSLGELKPLNIDTCKKLIHPDDIKYVENEIEKLFRKEIEYYSCELRMRHKDGQWIWVHDVGKVNEWDEFGKPVIMSGIHTDISALKQYQIEVEESRRKNKSIFSKMLNAFALHEIVLDDNNKPIDYIFIEVNDAFESMTGLKSDDIIGKTVTQVIPGIENDPARWIEVYGKVATTGEEIKFENRIQNTDHWFRVYAFSPEKNKFATIFEDISYQKKNEHKVISSEKKFREVIEYNAIPMILTDKNQDIVLYNKKFSETFGYTIDDISTAKKWWKTVYPDPDYQKIVNEQWNAAIEKAEKNNTEIEPQKWKMRCKDGTDRIVEFYFRPLGDINVISMKDITDIERKQEELSAVHEIYQKTIENAQSVPYKVNFLSKSYDFVSEKCEDLLGIKRENLTFEKLRNMVKNPSVTDVRITKDYREYNKLFKEGKLDSYHVEFQVDTPHEGLKWISDRSLTIKENGKVVGSMGILQDITELKISEVALRKSEERFKLAVEGTNDGLWDWNIKSQFIYHSERFSTMLGYEYGELPFSYDIWSILIHPEDKDAALKHINDYLDRKIDKYQATYRMRCKDNTYKWISGRGKALFNEDNKPYRFVGFITDISEIKKNEEINKMLELQIRRSQKLETLGTLAGGIAHDFNNILTPIMGYADMAKSKLKKDDGYYDVFDEIFSASLRARDLIYQMLNFSRQSEHQRAPMDISVVLKEALKLIRPSIPSTIEIKEMIDSKSKKILGDPTKIHQVIMNLCTNAYQAMEGNGGELFIELKPVIIDEQASKQYLDLNEGEYLKMSISDTGIGMDDSVKDRIFEPFFTTKEVNKGTGLGLAVVHGIVHSHDGAITVYSEKGKGSTFNVFFPVIKSSDVKKTTNYKKEIGLGNESILIVDDKVSVTKILNKMLTGLGYSTTIINSSKEGLKIFQEKPDEFHLVITDLTMPEMTGLELAVEIHKVKDDVPIIMVTGYGNQVKQEDMKRAGINKLIGKPILLHDISTALREILDK